MDRITLDLPHEPGVELEPVSARVPRELAVAQYMPRSGPLWALSVLNLTPARVCTRLLRSSLATTSALLFLVVDPWPRLRSALGMACRCGLQVRVLSELLRTLQELSSFARAGRGDARGFAAGSSRRLSGAATGLLAAYVAPSSVLASHAIGCLTDELVHNAMDMLLQLSAPSLKLVIAKLVELQSELQPQVCLGELRESDSAGWTLTDLEPADEPADEAASVSSDQPL